MRDLAIYRIKGYEQDLVGRTQEFREKRPLGEGGEWGSFGLLILPYLDQRVWVGDKMA